MGIRRVLTVITTVVFVCSGCSHYQAGAQIKIAKGPNPWTNLEFLNEPDNFQFAIVADRTGGERPGIFENAVKKLNLLRPEFTICVGDLIEGYNEDQNEVNRQWDELGSLVGTLEMPLFYAVGNHDYTNPAMAKTWEKRLGRSYYSFVYRKCLFLCLNTQDGSSTGVSEGQIEFFRKTLQANRNARWTFVFMHQPIWRGQGEPRWKRLESLLDDRPFTVFAGHIHRHTRFVEKGHVYYTVAAAGGAITDDGICGRDGVTWVTMTDEGPVAVPLLLEGVLGNETCEIREGVAADE